VCHPDGWRKGTTVRAPAPAKHPRSPDCDHSPTRHLHPYVPGTNGYKRCNCGSRNYQITTGGVLPPVVTCEKCHKENATATAYERGVTAGRNQAKTALQAPLFPDRETRLVAAVGTLGDALGFTAMLLSGMTGADAWTRIRSEFETNGDQELIDLVAADPGGADLLDQNRISWHVRGFPPPWDMVSR